MPIIGFEGASAVGKTSTCKKLAAEHDAFVVEEVSKMFAKPQEGQRHKKWYLDRQVERWTLAKNKEKEHSLVILDGDPIQSLWYRWCFNFEGWNSLVDIRDTYRHEISTGKISFPDKYFILTANEEELRRRKNSDLINTRRNFELHLRFIEPLWRYFNYLSVLRNDYVVFIEATSINQNVEIVISETAHVSKMSTDQALVLFDNLVEWVGNNKV